MKQQQVFITLFIAIIINFSCFAQKEDGFTFNPYMLETYVWVEEEMKWELIISGDASGLTIYLNSKLKVVKMATEDQTVIYLITGENPAAKGGYLLNIMREEKGEIQRWELHLDLAQIFMYQTPLISISHQHL